METLQPPGWPRPRGYANGIAAEGRLVFVAGQIGWDDAGSFPPEDFAGQPARPCATSSPSWPRRAPAPSTWRG